MVNFLTDGMLLSEIQGDPLLQEYSIVMVDDIHERSIESDILLGLLKKIQKKRKDLKLIISSATLDSEKLRDFFEGSVILSIQGR